MAYRNIPNKNAYQESCHKAIQATALYLVDVYMPIGLSCSMAYRSSMDIWDIWPYKKVQTGNHGSVRCLHC